MGMLKASQTGNEAGSFTGIDVEAAREMTELVRDDTYQRPSTRTKPTTMFSA